MENPEISVIVPTYNPKIELLERCLHSISEQSYHNFEIIVVDDGSTEQLHEQIRQITLRYDNVNLLVQENKGVSAARNNGITHARGKYLAFVDDDDIVSPFFLEESSEIMTREDCDMVIGGVIHQTDEVFPSIVLEKENLRYEVLNDSACRKFSFELLGEVRHVSHGAYFSRGPVAKLVRKDLGTVLFPEEYVYGEDNIWNLRLLSTVQRIALVDRAWYLYITNNHSASRKCTPTAMTEAERLINAVAEIIHFSDKKVKDYGDYVFFEVKELFIRWFNHRDCPLSEFEKIKIIRSMARREPWKVLSSRAYLKKVNGKRRFHCILFREGLLSSYWKFRNAKHS